MSAPDRRFRATGTRLHWDGRFLTGNTVTLPTTEPTPSAAAERMRLHRERLQIKAGYIDARSYRSRMRLHRERRREGA